MADARAVLRRWGGPAAALAVLGAALALLHHELRDFRYHEVSRAVRAIPLDRLGLAALLTAVAYAILPGYDALAVTYVGKRLPIPRLAFGSLVAYGLSQTLGFPLVTAGAVRYRFWSAWGLSTTEIAQAAGFVGATFTVGVVAVCGAALLLEPNSTLAVLHLPPALARGAGLLLVALVATYVGWSVARSGRPIRVRGWEFPVPRPALALAQVGLAVGDWAAAGAVLYALLPSGHGLSLLAFLGVFVLAQFAGLVSHVPGGLGVFETVMLVLLRPHLPANQAVAALLAYRAVYYLAPFGAALAALGAYELRRRQERLVGAVAGTVSGTAALVGRWGPAVLPTALSFTVFLGGALLLFSGATPSVRGRVAALDDVLPLGIIEISHLTGGLAGAALLVLAAGIRRRLDAAWALTVATLGAGIVASLLKGLDYEEATVLALVLAAVLPARRAFYRKATLTSEPFTPEWIVAVVTVLAVTAWLGFFSYRHVGYSGALWLRFAQRANAPRFLRASAGVAALLVATALSRLLRVAGAEPHLPTADELERIAPVVRAAGSTVANLALLGDKALLVSEGGDGFIQYGVAGRSWVALGDPVGPPAVREELAWRFREEAHRHGAWPVFYEVSADQLPLYIDLGLTLLKLGEEASVDLAAFGLEGRKGLRRVLKDVEKAGGSFEVVGPEAVDALMPELRRVSDAWLGGRTTREKGFSLGHFDEAYLRRFPAAVVRGADGEVAAFANLWTSGGLEELSVDLMRHTDAAPRGVMDYLFVRLMLWGREQGYRRFNLGMAPLSGLGNRQLAPLWTRAGSMLFRHGEHFYNFRGLRAYKEKFDPAWEPRYLASPGGLALPRVLANVTSLISGGLSGVLTK